MRARVLGTIPLVVVVLFTGGCGSAGFSGLYGAPLPGGADLGDRPFHATVDFADVLDLVPQAGVKVNDVAVGRVDTIDLAADNKTAEVHITVNGDVHLPANLRAELRQSSLLGEKYIELVDPTDAPTGVFREGSVITKDRTDRDATVEEVLGALSLLLNGGGVQQLSGIVRELDDAMVGREPQLRATLSTVDNVVRDLDGQRANIIKAIDGMNRLSATLAGQTKNIQTALDGLTPGLRVLNDQRQQLVSMLAALNRLSGVATNTVNASHADMVADLKDLEPALRQLAAAGNNLPKAMEILLSYPFPEYAQRMQLGDYANADIDFELDLDHLLPVLASQAPSSSPLPPPPPTPGAPTVPPLPLPPLPLPTAPPGGSGAPGGGLLGWLPGGH